MGCCHLRKERGKEVLISGDERKEGSSSLKTPVYLLNSKPLNVLVIKNKYNLKFKNNVEFI